VRVEVKEYIVKGKHIMKEEESTKNDISQATHGKSKFKQAKNTKKKRVKEPNSKEKI